MGWHNWSNQWNDLASQQLKCCFDHSEMPKTKSVSKVVRYNYFAEQAQVVYYMKKDPQWLLLLQQRTLFLVIFGTVFLESDKFVIFTSLNENGALFANDLSDIPILFC